MVLPLREAAQTGGSRRPGSPRAGRFCGPIEWMWRRRQARSCESPHLWLPRPGIQGSLPQVPGAPLSEEPGRQGTAKVCCAASGIGLDVRDLTLWGRQVKPSGVCEADPIGLGWGEGCGGKGEAERRPLHWAPAPSPPHRLTKSWHRNLAPAFGRGCWKPHLHWPPQLGRDLGVAVRGLTGHTQTGSSRGLPPPPCTEGPLSLRLALIVAARGSR